MAAKVRKAVIAAAGMGTRFLPQTKAMPKEMLPIIDKPVIQMVVESAVKAGVEDVIIVTGSTKRSIEDHFDRSYELESELKKKGKDDIADKLRDIAELANFVYIRQKGDVKGNAIPVINAEHMLGNEPFFYFFADDFFTGEVSYAEQMLNVYKQTGCSVLALRQITPEETSKYGVVSVEEEVREGVVLVNGYAEKPGPEKAPSHYACVCGYLLTPDILEEITTDFVAEDGEVRMADAIDRYSKRQPVYGVVIKGDYHDTGSPELYLQTLIDVALNHPEYGPTLQEFLQKRSKQL
jgi:UTP--glucose-1-phosphate uridylyltransferase